DIDSIILNFFESRFKDILKDKLKIINVDFLEWAESKNGKFDLILMNPPFNLKKTHFIKNEYTEFINKNVPLELAFLLSSLNLLEDDGTLLAILPASIISGISTTWFRKALLTKGYIRVIHELPEFSFPYLGSRVYICVLTKTFYKKPIALLNHSLVNPHKLNLKQKNILNPFRLDYGYYEGINWLNKIIKYNQSLTWDTIGSKFSVMRGSLKSPDGARNGLHTTDYINGFWSSTSKESLSGAKNYDCSNEDILIKRVGRNCSKSFGVLESNNKLKCSDCLLIIKTQTKTTRNKILFALRVIYNSKFGNLIIERGTGASFISSQTLKSLKLPTNLSELFPVYYKIYSRAIKKSSLSEMLIIEQEVRIILDKK
ncbi:MAG: hypothetical protein EOP00_13895, partial [Pedobacter sp.]